MYGRILITACGLALLVFAGCADKEVPKPPPAVKNADTSTDPPEVDLDTPGGDAATKPVDDGSDKSASTQTSSAAGGTLRGKFVYDGKAPDPTKLAVNKDVEVCGPASPMDESLVVGPDGGIANILIWVRSNDVATAAPPQSKVVLDNLGCRFDPHVLIVHTGQILEITNSDPIGHNANVATVLNPPRNSAIAPSGNQQIEFSKEERLPAKVSCGIHPWMTGWVLVADDTYNAVTMPDGSFEITGLPLGRELEFQVWQEKAGYLADVTTSSGDKWERGRFTATFNGEVVDLGTIKVSPQAFAGK